MLNMLDTLRKRRYVLEEQIGVGSFATVYRAHDKLRKQREAIKIIRRRPGDHEPDEIRFAHMLHGVHAFVQLLDHFKTKNNYYLVYELLEGGELFERIHHHGLSNEDARRATLALLKAVWLLHDMNIIHRDLKLENILLRSRDGPVDDFVVADFGLAADVDRRPDSWAPGRCGSLGYMGPEVITTHSATRASDMFSVGIIAYALLTGSSPFSSVTAQGLVVETVCGRIPFPEEQWRHIPYEAAHFVYRCLQRKPEDRMTAGEALNHPWIRTVRRQEDIASPSLRSQTSSIFTRYSQDSAATSIVPASVSASRDEQLATSQYGSRGRSVCVVGDDLVVSIHVEIVPDASTPF